MNVIIEDDVIKFPYKLQRGVSKQYIALELLRKNGFDQDILDEALQIKKKLTT
jgi:DNA mismatch repair ATPase MutS